jgi:hypothetical protein
MKTYLLLFLGIFTACGVANAQLDSIGIPVQAPIVRQTTGGAISTYSSLDTAVLNAIDGDTLYSATTINKKLTMFGTGYNSDSSRTLGKTRIMGTAASGWGYTYFTLGANTKGSFFCGIHFDCQIQANAIIAEDIYFSRCQIKNFYSNGVKVKVNFRESVIGNTYISSNSTLDASNCLFEGYLVGNYSNLNNPSQSNLKIQNSILLGSSLYSYSSSGLAYGLIVGFSSIDISNSFIFLKPNSNASYYHSLLVNSHDNFSNCLFVGDSTSTNNMNSSTMTISGNARQPQSFRQNVFVHLDDTFLPSSDYHLLSNSPYTNKGIYSGTITKFRATPPVHISSASVIRQSDGQLKIIFGVQTNNP